MGLRLTIRPDERVIVNGSILRNVGATRIQIEIENRSDVLRGDEIITIKQATTPVRRLCHFIQVALASPENRAATLVEVNKSFADVYEVLGKSQSVALHEVRAEIDRADYYAALRFLRPVMAHEGRLLQVVHST